MKTTLGRRIQAGRRDAGLSQEALGERLGVSRQAVSKWEADAAVPELENLIAMSGLFGLSVGALLGVEPPEEQPVPEEPPAAPEEAASDAGLTERELAAVEAIAAKYMEEAERRRRPRPSLAHRSLAVLCAALVLLAAGGTVWKRVSAMDRQLRDMSRRMDELQSVVSGQIGSLSGNISNILSEESSILSNSSVRVTDFDLKAETITLTVSAQPKAWSEGTTAVFVARQPSGTESASASVTGRNGVFTVEGWEIPMGEEIFLSVVLTDGDGNQTGMLDTLYDCLPGNFRLEVFGSWGSSWSSTAPSRITLKGLDLQITTGSRASVRYAPAGLKAVDLCLYRNQETEPETVFPVTEAPKLWRDAGYVGMQNFTDYTTSYELAPGETMVAAVRITDGRGETTWTVLNAYGADKDGKAAALDSKGDWKDYIWKPGHTIR